VSPARVIRVSDEQDGELLNRLYSYWSNSVLLNSGAFAFVGHADGQPRFFRVDLDTGELLRLGSLLGYGGTSEGWFWTQHGWITLCDGPRLRTANPFNGGDQVLFDISETHPGCRLWQAHSDDEGLTHSATVERITTDGPYQRIGTVVFRTGAQRFFPAQGVLDESQIDRSGRFLIIKEDDNNRIIDLVSGEWVILQQDEGAVGHSDCGSGFVVGEDDHYGACVRWDLTMPIHAEQRRELFSTWGMGHVSVRGNRCLLSDTTHLSLVALDGSGVVPILEHGMLSDGSYDTQVHASLSPCGRLASYVSNAAGRMDLYVVEVR